MAPLPQTMLACRVNAFGPPSAIAFEHIPVPSPGEGEVLVRVHAAGVGPWDGWIRSGKSALPQPLPLTLGSDLAGTIASLGPGVTHLAVGDAVFGVTNPQFTGSAEDQYARTVFDDGVTLSTILPLGCGRVPSSISWASLAEASGSTEPTPKTSVAGDGDRGAHSFSP